MPMYEYVCQECGARFEKLVRMSADPQVVECPGCASTTVERALSTFATNSSSQRSTAAPSCGPVG